MKVIITIAVILAIAILVGICLAVASAVFTQLGENTDRIIRYGDYLKAMDASIKSLTANNK